MRDRPTLDSTQTTAPLPFPPQSSPLMPRRRTTRMSGGPRPTPPRRHHNAAAASRAAVCRRRIARAIPWVHARSSPPAGSSPLAHPPLRTPSAAGSHTATPPRRHTATPPPCDQAKRLATPRGGDPQEVPPVAEGAQKMRLRRPQTVARRQHVEKPLLHSCQQLWCSHRSRGRRVGCRHRHRGETPAGSVPGHSDAPVTAGHRQLVTQTHRVHTTPPARPRHRRRHADVHP